MPSFSPSALRNHPLANLKSKAIRLRPGLARKLPLGTPSVGCNAHTLSSAASSRHSQKLRYLYCLPQQQPYAQPKHTKPKGAPSPARLVLVIRESHQLAQLICMSDVPWRARSSAGPARCHRAMPRMTTISVCMAPVCGANSTLLLKTYPA